MAFEYPIYRTPAASFTASHCKGNNAERMLVLVENADLTGHSELLSKIVSAVGLDLEEDTHLLAMNKNDEIALLSSEGMRNYDRILSFGIPLTHIGYSVDVNSGSITLESIKLLKTVSLGMIATSKEDKRVLWEILKREFKH